MIAKEALRQAGLASGLAAVGFTDAEPFDRARERIERNKARGFDGGMQFTYRNPERSTTPMRILPSAQTLIVGAWPYPSVRSREAEASGDRPTGQIAAYAWRDHYGELRDALAAIGSLLTDDGFRAIVVCDDNALVDRAAAIRAGLGWAGKNSNVLLPGQGSWFVLGAVVTDAVIEPDEPVADECATCRRCIDGCPTGAIVADGIVDARRCLAWLLQADGPFPGEFREALGTRIYGCDDCQEVCPPSRRNRDEPTGSEVTGIDLLELLAMDDEEIMDAVGAWYIPKRDARYVRRNALVALGNARLGASHAEEAAAQIERHLAGDEMVAEHARWAADRLGLI